MSDILSEKEVSIDNWDVFDNTKPTLITKLTEEQKQKIFDAWKNAPAGKTPTLKELSLLVYGKELDLRHPDIRLIKKHLATLDFKIPSQQKGEIKKEVQPIELPQQNSKTELSEEQKEYIRNNYKHHSTVIDLCKTLFSKSSIPKNDPLLKKVVEYLQEEDLLIEGDNYENYNDTPYTPPETMQACLNKIKKYVPKVEWTIKTLNEKQRKCLNTLSNFISTLRYKNQIDSYQNVEDKELFESEFIRCTYDKPDLSEEDVDQYIVYSNEVVISKNISRSICRWQDLMDESLEDENDKKNINMTFVEAIGKMRDEYNQSIKRQGELLKTLTTKRSERISKLKEENASILTLVQAVKQEEYRNKLIKISEKRKSLLKEEVDRLMTMDEIKSQIWGITEEDIFNG